LKSGDREAFRQLVEAYKNPVLNICYGFMQDRQYAEDLAQEVFIEVYSSLKDFREDANLFTWIYRIATTKSLDELRKQKRLKRRAFYSAITRQEEEPQMESIGGSINNPEEDLIRKQQAQAIQQALDRIPENQRIAFTLSNYQGMSYKEIAEVMEKTTSAVESLLMRAKSNLKTELEDFYRQLSE
jgi:RNA polymerase sigma-70 factor (ECF subfamily)